MPESDQSDGRDAAPADVAVSSSDDAQSDPAAVLEETPGAHHLHFAIAFAAVAVLFGVLAVVNELATKLTGTVSFVLAALFLLLTLVAISFFVRAQLRARAAARREVRQQRRAEINELLRVKSPYSALPRLSEISDEAFGVALNKYGDRTDAPYVQRPVADRDVDLVLSKSEPPYPFLLVVGEALAGKTRTTLEAVRSAFGGRNPAVIIPKNGRALVDLTRVRPLPSIDPAPAIVWLDDIDGPLLDHLSWPVIDEISRWALIVATIPLRRYQQLRRGGSDVATTAHMALSRAEVVELELALTDEELAQARWRYPSEEFKRSVGEALVGAPELVSKYRIGGQANAPGTAIVQAMVDWRRAGLNWPIPDYELRRLFPLYLRAIDAGVAPDAEQFTRGMDWATEPISMLEGLVHPVGSGKTGGWAALDYLVAVDDGMGDLAARPVPGFAWQELLAMAGPADAFGIAVSAYLRGDHRAAADGFRYAIDAGGSSHRLAATVGSGMAMSKLGDNDGARAAFHTVIESGHRTQLPKAALHLGLLLSKQGDVLGARTALDQAIASDHPEHAPRAAFSLGLLLARHSEPAAAEAAFNQAIRSGHPDASPSAAVGLGGILTARGDIAAARAVYQQAVNSGHPDAASLAQELLSELPPEPPAVVGYGGPAPAGSPGGLNTPPNTPPPPPNPWR
ncbi:tetratricopeptide repeat protein [Flindersiella endophytica]